MSHRTRTSRTDHNNCNSTREFPNRLIFLRTSLASFFIFGIVENTQLKRLCVSWRSKTKTNHFRQKGWNTDPAVQWAEVEQNFPGHVTTALLLVFQTPSYYPRVFLWFFSLLVASLWHKEANAVCPSIWRYGIWSFSIVSRYSKIRALVYLVSVFHELVSSQKNSSLDFFLSLM